MLAVLVLALAPAAIGCVGSGGSNNSLASVSDSAAASVETQPNSEGAVAMGQSVETPNGHNVTVQKAAWWGHSGAFVHSDLDNLFWVVRIRACTPPSNSSLVLVFSDEYTLMLDDGDKLHPLASGRKPWFASGEIPPGQCTSAG